MPLEIGKTYKDSVYRCERCPKTIKSNKWSVIKSNWYIVYLASYCSDHYPVWILEAKIKNGSLTKEFYELRIGEP